MWVTLSMISVLLASLLLASLLHVSSCLDLANGLENATSIRCKEGKTQCDECYITMVKNLVYDDENIFNLSRVFLPPTQQPPVFVIVKYQIIDNETQTWYWTKDTSSLLHPIEGFQYFTLFFGNYQWLIGTVYVTLPADCANASQEFFQLVTQRLQVHTSTLSITPRIRPEDHANSANLDIIKDKLHPNHYLATILWLYQIIVPIVTLIAFACAMYSLHDKIGNLLPKDEVERDATTFSIVAMSIIAALFAICMDIVGIVWATTRVPRSSVKDYAAIIHDSPRLTAVFLLPLIMLIFYDFLGLGIILCEHAKSCWNLDWNSVICSIHDLIEKCCQCRQSANKQDAKESGTKQSADQHGKSGTKQSADQHGKSGTKQSADQHGESGTKQSADQHGESGTEQSADQHGESGTEQSADQHGESGTEQPADQQQHGDHNQIQQLLLSESTKSNTLIIAKSLVGIVVILSNHSYYILIAFANDPVHANSIGIYYAITIVVYLFLLKLLWKTIGDNKNKVESDVEARKKTGKKRLCSAVSLISATMVMFLVLFQVLVTATFVYIPIKRTIEDVPTQINSIYRSLLVVLAALITYQIFFKKKDKDSDEETQTSDAHIQQQTKIEWVTVCGIKLTNKDKKCILKKGSWLDDRIIHAAMLLIKNYAESKNKEVSGLLDPAVLKVMDESRDQYKGSLKTNGLQILHTKGNHWITISTIGTTAPAEGGEQQQCVMVHIYDSLQKVDDNKELSISKQEAQTPKATQQEPPLSDDTTDLIAHLLNTNKDNIEWQCHKVQKQDNGSECGLFAIAFAFEICKGDGAAPELQGRKFYTYCKKMRKHLVDCFEKGVMESFPHT